MDDSQKGHPIKVKFSDKRRRTEAKESQESPVTEATPDSPAETSEPADASGAQEPQAAGPQPEAEENYLEDLRRVQAEFDNYRKRMLREQTQLAQRASARLVERLLPILDNFESAISHGEGGSGVELVYRELKKLMEDEGLEEIKAEDTPFDPTKHEAFEAVEDESVEEPTVRSVLRPGYLFKGQVMRPSMVSVARPAEEESQEESSVDRDAAEG